ncbi:MAG: MBL fold metallo-hydrolase [Crenarchaeota archaeon]|nr:MBL fold metallo-hydrolase [Thermoproteota archaeon]
MKKYLIVLLFLLFRCAFAEDALKITYLANCGFLYESQSSKIIIDPFGTEFGDFFSLPSSDTRTKIETGIEPFDKIDLVLITHIHGDHFNPFLAEKFLLNNKDTRIICPPQVFKEIKDTSINFKQIESQIISPRISMNDLKTININGITVTAVRMQHGTDRSLQGIKYEDYTDYEKTENFGYLIYINNKVIFHQGDGDLKHNELAVNNLNGKVDIAHLSFFDWDSISCNLLKEKFQTKNIIFMHGTKPGEELETKEMKLIESKLIFFKHELESKSF